jgi:hypothetical protein
VRFTLPYINRLFFRKDNGACLYRYWQKGNILKTTIEQDLAAIKPLHDYTPESIIVIEIPEDDIETQEKLNRCKSVSLDIETNELIFEFTPEEEEKIKREATLEEQIETMKQSIAELSAIISTILTPQT